MTEPQKPQYLESPNGRLAYRLREGDPNLAGVVWFGGYRSDMLGSKASRLDEFCAGENIPFLRFDYSGHGESGGNFEDGTIGQWAADAQAIIDRVFDRPVIIIGSSMGAWIAVLFALARADRVRGAIFIAPAPDFTERLMVPTFTQDDWDAIERHGRLEIASDYGGEPYIYTKAFLDDARKQCVLHQPIKLPGTIRFLHGLRDEVVPLSHVVEFASKIDNQAVHITLLKDGDHRLSTEDNLELLMASVRAAIDAA